jgi:NADH dehydrogenase FAD-containing subunit
MNFKNYTHVIQDTVVSLDRLKRVLILQSGASMTYDVLIFSSGLEFNSGLLNKGLPLFRNVVPLNQQHRDQVYQAIKNVKDRDGKIIV